MERISILSTWKEYNDYSTHSLISDFNYKYDNKNNVLDYLKSGKLILLTTDKCVDVATGNLISQTGAILSDGTYTWNSDIIYYVSLYNLKLPDYFLKHIEKVTEPKIKRIK